jgi:hypothetical protein
MKVTIKNIVNESYYKKSDDDTLKNIANRIRLPYIKEIGHYGITNESDISLILSHLFGKELKRGKSRDRWFVLSDKENRVIYAEMINEDNTGYPLGSWMLYKHEDDRFPTRWTNKLMSNGDTETREYNEDGSIRSTTYGDIEVIPKRITESVDKKEGYLKYVENKKYVDKVIESLVRSTKIDYENDRIFTPFSPNSLPVSLLLSIVKDWNTSPLLHRLKKFMDYIMMRLIMYGMNIEILLKIK